MMVIYGHRSSGGQALHKIRMGLQSEDGNLGHPLGLLENIVLKSYGIEYEHTFVVVECGQDLNYEVILG